MKNRKLLTVTIILMSTIFAINAYADTYEDPIGVNSCSNSAAHCGSCGGEADRTIIYAFSSAPVEQYEEEYTRYYTK